MEALKLSVFKLLQGNSDLAIGDLQPGCQSGGDNEKGPTQ